MVLLSAEKRLQADEIAEIIRERHVTVLRWHKRFLDEGIGRTHLIPPGF